MMKRFIGNSAMPLAALSLLGLSVSAQAAGTNDPAPVSSTQVQISATVRDNTCEVESTQGWKLGDVNGVDIINGKTFPETIELTNCGKSIHNILVTPDAPTMTSEGSIPNQATTGASTVMAQILGGDNAADKDKPLTNNKPESFNVVQSGGVSEATQNLKFNVKLLQADGKKPSPGTYQANVSLKLAYN